MVKLLGLKFVKPVDKCTDYSDEGVTVEMPAFCFPHGDEEIFFIVESFKPPASSVLLR